jgi:hypothetical protein
LEAGQLQKNLDGAGMPNHGFKHGLVQAVQDY